jgi:voltage-gated potassium channel
MSSKSRRRIPRILQKVFFLDVFFDPRSRPMLIYMVIILLIGAVLYHWLEGWSWIDSFYFVVITLTTIGYGDLTPTTSITKLITIFYGINGVIVLLTFFDIIRRYRHMEMPTPGRNQQKNIDRTSTPTK